ncbi:MAG: arylesterase [Bacteroidota bacterium]
MKVVLISLSLFFLLLACTSNTEEDSQKSVSENSSPVLNDEKEVSVSIPIILFFGNSLTAGYLLEMEQAFPALIQQKIDSLDLEYEVRNSGVSGETSTGGDSRIEFVLNTLTEPLAVFVLELGANDGLRGIAPPETEKSLQSILNKVKTAYPECQILLCGMEAPPNMGDDFTNAFREIFPKLVSTNQVSFLPFLLDGVAGNPELNLADGIHPTPEGHKIVAGNVWESLEPLLGKE